MSRPDVSKIADNPFLLAGASLLPPLAHLVSSVLTQAPIRRPEGFNDIVNGVLTAAGFLASIAGITSAFLLSERGLVFRNLRKQFGKSLSRQVLSLFGLPTMTMLFAITTLLPVPGGVAVLLLEACGGLLLTSTSYQFLFLWICVQASSTQDRDEENQAAFDNVAHLPLHRRSEG
ncbi:hypothetical protein [Actinomyces sp. HMT897]|uniref:hypothetical protein n=1 Tax=Actinomyces sp. HMT897 TaxID=2789424 RepID=UPI0019097887|nr:hypothetical protein [Actinomyces sp. HMT897]QQO78138.1 hypothetical protein JJJ15_01880 [Actinomyces sp. HMT897]